MLPVTKQLLSNSNFGGSVHLLKIRMTSLFLIILWVSPVYAAEPGIRVVDGDTIINSSEEKIRLLQIDAPEISPAECYGTEAQKALISLIGKSSVTLEADPVSDDQDQFGRKLRYLKVGKTNLNLKLVQIGAATPYFYQGQKGKYANQLLKAAQSAKAMNLGLWKKCPGTKLDTSKPATTGVAATYNLVTSPKSSIAKCDPNYQGCIPSYPPDLDCTDIKRLGLAPIRVTGKDVHKFDRDGDGVGCDS